MNNDRTAINFILIAGFIIEAFLIVFLIYNGPTGNIPLFMFIYGETFLIMLSVFYFIKKLDIKDELPEGRQIEDPLILTFFAKLLSLKKEDAGKLKMPLIIVLIGIIFRITLIPTINTTSPDINRYIWEGKILYRGFNPYTTPPSDPQLSRFHDNLYNKVTFKEMTAIYPPAAELIFAASYSVFKENLLGLKLINLLCDLLIMGLLLKLLYLKKIDLNNILLYAWLSLIPLEFFVNTHLDLIGVFFMVLFIYFIEKEKYIGASVSLAFSFLIKIYPVILLPLVIKKIGIKNSLKFIFIFIIISAIFYLPFIYKDFSIFNSLITYLKTWQFNASVFYLLKHQILSENAVRLICGISFMAAIGIISYLYRDFTKAVYGVFIVWIIFSSTLYPWYLGWIAAINPFFNFYSVTSLLFTINFSNFSPLGPLWKDYVWVLLIQYIPFYILLIYDLFLMREKLSQDNLIIRTKF